MKGVIALAFTLLISVSQAFGQETSEKLFRELENQIAQAAIAKDAAQLNKLFTSDYVSVGGEGQIRSKVEVIDGITRGRRVFTAAQIEKITVRRYTDTAIVVGVLTMSGKDADRDISGRYAFTRIYKREPGEWRAVSFQTTPVK